MRTAFVILLVVHGLIHLLGFIKAYKFAPVNELSIPISEAKGIFWLVSAILFVVAALLFLLKSDAWWILSLVAVLLSQYLIFTSWQDAKFGTIANIIILAATIIGLGNWRFSNKYENEVKTGLKGTTSSPEELLTEAESGSCRNLCKITCIIPARWGSQR